MNRREAARDPRGYFGVGIYSPKISTNVGTLWRSAYCLGASFIFTIGQRCKHQPSDVLNTWKHIPLFEYADLEQFNRHRPFDAPLIGVELCDRAKPLETFKHPQRAIYLLGPEDGSLPISALDLCQYVVQFESRYCLNVASAGTIVMYDRQTKGVCANAGRQ